MIADIGYEIPDCSKLKFETEPTIFYRDNFNDLITFFKAYEVRATQEAINAINKEKTKANQALSGTNPYTPATWYGDVDRMEKRDFDFLYNRNNFVYWDEYKDLKKKVDNQVQKLFRNQSVADVIKKNFEWNEKELGLFSFDRASIGLLPKYCFYSPKYDKTFQEDYITTEGDGEETKYFLKEDKSEIVLSYEIILNEPKDGKTSIYVDAKKNINLEEINKIGYLSVVSNVKKSFIYQVDKPKIANAIRIFIDFGCNANVQWKEKIFNGMFGIILSEVFEYLGYSTSIIPYIGFKRYDDSGKKVYRLLAYQAKKFTETLETERLLVSCSDIAFFRTKFFVYAHLLSDYYKNKPDEGIGYSLTREESQCSMIQYFKNKDKNKDVYYYNISEINSEEKVIEMLTYLILNIDNENKKLNEERQKNSGQLSGKEKIYTQEEIMNKAKDIIKEI
jgi:hypothetical protein